MKQENLYLEALKKAYKNALDYYRLKGYRNMCKYYEKELEMLEDSKEGD
jgi:hypothetical protein